MSSTGNPDYSIGDRRSACSGEASDVISSILSTADVLEQFYNDMDRHFQNATAKPYGFTTGFSYLDDQLCGYRNNELIIIGGRPSMGKTSFALNIARNMVVQSRRPVGVLSYDMSALSIMRRILSAHTRINFSKLVSHIYTKDEVNVLMKAGSLFNKLPLWIDEVDNTSLSQLLEKMRYLRTIHGVELIIIDYLQLITIAPRDKSFNLMGGVDEIMRKLKQMTKELDIPIVVLSQLSRKCERRAIPCPKLSDLYGAGITEGFADIVMLLYRPSYYQRDVLHHRDGKPENVELIVAKNRYGPTGVANLDFFASQARFELCSLL